MTNFLQILQEICIFNMGCLLSINCYRYYPNSGIPAFRCALINRFLPFGLLYYTFSVSPGAEYEQSQPELGA
jgi:hypothetical protein